MRREPIGDSLIILDEIDRTIIHELQQDGRRPYGRIAEAARLSEAAVRQRTQRMLEEGVIRIVAVPDATLLGMTVGATLCIQCAGDLGPVAAALDAINQIDFVVATAGNFDLLAEVQCEDHEALYRLINDSVRKLPGVQRVESHIYLRYHKQTYAWPPVSREVDGRAV